MYVQKELLNIYIEVPEYGTYQVKTLFAISTMTRDGLVFRGNDFLNKTPPSCYKKKLFPYCYIGGFARFQRLEYRFENTTVVVLDKCIYLKPHIKEVTGGFLCADVNALYFIC